MPLRRGGHSDKETPRQRGQCAKGDWFRTEFAAPLADTEDFRLNHERWRGEPHRWIEQDTFTCESIGSDVNSIWERHRRRGHAVFAWRFVRRRADKVVSFPPSHRRRAQAQSLSRCGELNSRSGINARALKVHARPVPLVFHEMDATLTQRFLNLLERLALTTNGLVAPFDAKHCRRANVCSRRQRLRTPTEQRPGRSDQVTCDHLGPTHQRLSRGAFSINIDLFAIRSDPMKPMRANPSRLSPDSTR